MDLELQCVNERQTADINCIRLTPNEFEFLETVGDAVKASERNVHLVPKKPNTFVNGGNGTKVCVENARPTSRIL